VIERTQKLLNSIFGTDIKGMVVTIIAPAGLGKTTFSCMQLPAYIYSRLKEQNELNENTRIYIVNTDLSFLEQRFLEVLEEFDLSYKEVRNYLKIDFVTTMSQQENTIKQIVKFALENVNANVPYIVVDPFNHILRMEFAKAHEDYRLNVVGRLSPKLEAQLNLLTLSARKRGTTVVITMLPKKKYVDKVPVAWQSAFFGPSEIAHLSDIVLWLSHGVHDPKGVTVHVLKHRLKETPYQVNCKLTKGGLIPV